MADHPTPPPSPAGPQDDPLTDTFAAFLRQDHDAFFAAVARHRNGLVAAVDDLTIVPEPMRDDDDAISAWVAFASSVAEALQDLGDDAVAQRLFDSGPIERWYALLTQADRLREDGRYEASATVVGELLGELDTSRGTAVDAVRPKALGLAGANAFDLGDFDEAVRLTDLALRACEQTGDADGVEIYAANLATIIAARDADTASARPDDTTPTGGTAAVRRRLVRAQRLHDAARLVEAEVEVRAVVEAIGDLPTYRSKAYGLLGTIRYRRGALDEAAAFTRVAIDAGRAVGDQSAVTVYTANLATIDAASSPPSG